MQDGLSKLNHLMSESVKGLNGNHGAISSGSEKNTEPLGNILLLYLTLMFQSYPIFLFPCGLSQPHNVHCIGLPRNQTDISIDQELGKGLSVLQIIALLLQQRRHIKTFQEVKKNTHLNFAHTYHSCMAHGNHIYPGYLKKKLWIWDRCPDPGPNAILSTRMMTYIFSLSPGIWGFQA